MPRILQVLWDITMVIFRILGQVLKGLAYALIYLLAGSFELIGKIPSSILILILGASFLGAITSEKFRNSIGNGLVKAGDIIREAMTNVQSFIRDIIIFLEKLWEIFKPVGVVFIDFAMFFLAEFTDMKNEVELLEKNRAQ